MYIQNWSIQTGSDTRSETVISSTMSFVHCIVGIWCLLSCLRMCHSCSMNKLDSLDVRLTIWHERWINNNLRPFAGAVQRHFGSLSKALTVETEETGWVMMALISLAQFNMSTHARLLILDAKYPKIVFFQDTKFGLLQWSSSRSGHILQLKNSILFFKILSESLHIRDCKNWAKPFVKN